VSKDIRCADARMLLSTTDGMSLDNDSGRNASAVGTCTIHCATTLVLNSCSPWMGSEDDRIKAMRRIISGICFVVLPDVKMDSVISTPWVLKMSGTM
jgi:hypothetical protein